MMLALKGAGCGTCQDEYEKFGDGARLVKDEQGRQYSVIRNPNNCNYRVNELKP